MRKRKTNYDGRYTAELHEASENDLTISFKEGYNDKDGEYIEKIAFIKIHNSDIETILREYRKINTRRFKRATERIEKLNRIMSEEPSDAR